MEDIIYKKQEKAFELTDNGSCLVLAKDSEMVILNNVAFYIWDNINNKTLKELVDEIYEITLNKEEISYEEIYLDCSKSVQNLVELGLIKEV